MARSRSRPGERPTRSPSWTASIATRRVWPSVYSSFSARRTISARTRGPRKASSRATRSAARRSPVSGRDWASRCRSSATGPPTSTTPAISSAWPSHQVQPHGLSSSCGMRATPSQTVPTTTSRSAKRRVRVQVRTARTARFAKRARLTTSAATAIGPPGLGSSGTALGIARPSVPRARIVVRRAASRASSGRMLLGRRIGAAAATASTMAPTGSAAAPASALRPSFSPTRMSSVARPCTASSPDIAANAVPTSTARPSPRRAPTTVTAMAAQPAIVETAAIAMKWVV